MKHTRHTISIRHYRYICNKCYKDNINIDSEQFNKTKKCWFCEQQDIDCLIEHVSDEKEICFHKLCLKKETGINII